MDSETTPGPKVVLDFWFAPERKSRWFVKDPAFDAEVRTVLQPLHDLACSGALDHWQGDGPGCLALVLLLDQVPRNLFRDDARAFASDAQARAVTKLALDRGFDLDLGQVERLFLYLPLEHSEDLTDQEHCVALTETLDEDPAWCDYAKMHRDIIARFGRFPHRNQALGRDTTSEESAFLTEPNSSF